LAPSISRLLVPQSAWDQTLTVIYRFDSFELNGPQYRLSRGEEAIHVKPSVLELLVCLIEHRERVVSKAELLSALWQGRFVSDGVLSETVYEARRALGEDAANARFIKTLHARGYQFQFRPVQVIAGETGSPDSEGRCAYLLWRGGPTPLREGGNFIGRDPASAVVVASRQVSRQHARIVISGAETATLEDLASKNGTLLNGLKVASKAPLCAGDVIEIGGVALTFQGWLDVSTLTQIGDPRASLDAKAANELTAANAAGEAPAPRTG
jgi:DNA-binding winged helix-turn-helix (wHTH) protein